MASRACDTDRDAHVDRTMANPTQRRIVFLGCGYTAEVAAELFRDAGYAVLGTRRSPPQGSALIAFSGTAPSPDLAAAVRTATDLVVSIPPDDAGDPALRHHAADIAAASGLRLVTYLSTISVLGDHAGGWVDETTPPAPSSERSRRRLAAEEAWRALGARHGTPIAILRLPGIYGPGRSAIGNLKAGTARRIVKLGQIFNRIHVADIARVLLALHQQERTGAVYNLADDEPAPPEDVIAYAAELIGLPVPPAIPIAEAKLSPMAASFYGECKRVRNNRIKADLGLELAFPTYREGLRDILARS